VEFKGELIEGSRASSGITPRIASSVVTAGAIELRYLGLNERPNDRDVPRTTLEEDSGRARAAAVDVMALAPDVDQRAGRWWHGLGRKSTHGNSNWQYEEKREDSSPHEALYEVSTALLQGVGDAFQVV
jgi:hypothetical protein